MSQTNGPCTRARSLYSNAYDDAFAAGEREFFYAHLAQCPACEKEFAVYRKALLSLKALQPVSAPGGFEQRVLGAITEGAGRSTLVAMATEPAPTQPVATTRGRIVPLRLAAAAAVLVAAVSSLLTYTAVRAPEPPPPVPPGHVQAGDRLVPADQFVEEALRAKGFTRAGGRWVTRDEANALARGETYYRGRWWTQWELRTVLLSDLEEKPAEPAVAAVPGTPPAPRPAPAPAAPPPAEDALRALGYVKAGDRWVTPQEKESLDKGLVLYRDRWLSPADLKKEVLVAEGFVLHGDRWMTREERERLMVAEATAPRPATPQDELTVVLQNLSIGEPLLEDFVTVYPLYTRVTRPDEPWLPLDAALRGGKLEIRDEKVTRRLKARNADDRAVFLLAGELLAGGHQDRIVARDTLVPANRKWVDVEVYCAEPGRSAGRGESFESVPALAPPELRFLLAADAGQPLVWSGIRRRLDAASVKSRTDSLCSLYAQGPAPERLKALDRRLGDFPTRDVRTVGAAFGYDQRLAVAECFASNALFRQAWPKLLAAAAAQGPARRAPAESAAPPAVPNTRAGVNLLLEGAVGGEWVRRRAGPEGGASFQMRSGEAIFGEACLPEGRVGHAVLYADAAAVLPAPDAPAAYALEAGKAQRLAGELARVMGGTDEGEQARAVREFGSLRWDRAADTLAPYVATVTDDAVRLALAEALGATRSPAAVKPLVDLLEKAPRRSPLVRSAALALARTGDPKAIDPLVKLLNQGEPETARIGLDACVQLVPALRDGAAVDKALSRLIAYFEMLDAHARELKTAAAVCPTHPLYEALYGPLRTALSGLTRAPLLSGAEARTWWNKNRDTYLRGAAAK